MAIKGQGEEDLLGKTVRGLSGMCVNSVVELSLLSFQVLPSASSLPVLRTPATGFRPIRRTPPIRLAVPDSTPAHPTVPSWFDPSSVVDTDTRCREDWEGAMIHSNPPEPLSHRQAESRRGGYRCIRRRGENRGVETKPEPRRRPAASGLNAAEAAGSFTAYRSNRSRYALAAARSPTGSAESVRRRICGPA